MNNEEYEQIILELKEDIENRPNKLIFMKYKNFLRKFGMTNRLQKNLDLISDILDKNEIEVYANMDESGWSFTALPIDEMVTFRLKGWQSNLSNTTTKIDFAGRIDVANGENPVQPYLHQAEAMKELDKQIVLTNKNNYSGLLVIPTGGGKTLTTVLWLLRNYVDKSKKILWIAHRHELLEQAQATFSRHAFENLLKNRKSFNYRIISGIHDKPVNIKETDDIIIASKDSLNSGFNHLVNKWSLNNKSSEVFLVIDEAHHSVAKTYRKLISSVRDNVNHFQLLGLTATPIRTAENEKGLLRKIFTDDIAYKVDLRTLINRGILSEPIFEELSTGFDMTSVLTEKELEGIKYFDIESIGKATAKIIAENKIRNNRIVEHYCKNKEKYKQTLIFALGVDNAIALNKLFKEKGISSDYVISDIKDISTGVTISSKENKAKISRFRNGEINVLINVNILTEGTDLPTVQSVFLTRPTISPILIMQMIGRGLRGELSISHDAQGNKIKGTKNTYIVSFIDNWKDKIDFVNPEKLFISENTDFNDSDIETKKNIIRLVSIQKIEEFVKLTDNTIDTSDLETLDFIQRVPVGLYSFTILKPDVAGEEQNKFCEVLVYDNIKQAYFDFINDLEHFVETNDNSIVNEDELSALAKKVEQEYFFGCEKLPGYRLEDIKDILYYYDSKEIKPNFVEFKDRDKFDINKIANKIIEERLDLFAMDKYIDDIWDNSKDIWQAFLGFNKRYFISEIDLSLRKIRRPELYISNTQVPIDTKELREIEKLTMEQIREKFPVYWKKLSDSVYEKHKDDNGFYFCANTGYKNKSKLFFQIDHIQPMSEGGLTVSENLQLLKRSENMIKSNKWNS